MTCYIVSFQASELKAREKLRSLLRTYPKYCPINNTCWAILTDKKAKEVRDHLSEDLPSGDRVFVIRSGTEAAWRNSIGPKNSDWLKKNL